MTTGPTEDTINDIFFEEFLKLPEVKSMLTVMQKYQRDMIRYGTAEVTKPDDVSEELWMEWVNSLTNK